MTHARTQCVPLLDPLPAVLQHLLPVGGLLVKRIHPLRVGRLIGRWPKAQPADEIVTPALVVVPNGDLENAFAPQLPPRAAVGELLVPHRVDGPLHHTSLPLPGGGADGQEVALDRCVRQTDRVHLREILGSLDRDVKLSVPPLSLLASERGSGGGGGVVPVKHQAHSDLTAVLHRCVLIGLFVLLEPCNYHLIIIYIYIYIYIYIVHITVGVVFSRVDFIYTNYARERKFAQLKSDINFST